MREILSWLSKGVNTFYIESVSEYLFIKYLYKNYSIVFNEKPSLDGITFSNEVKESSIYLLDQLSQDFIKDDSIDVSKIKKSRFSDVIYTKERSIGCNFEVSVVDGILNINFSNKDNLFFNNQACAESLLELYAILSLVFYSQEKIVPKVKININLDTISGKRFWHIYNCKFFGYKFLDAVEILEPANFAKDLGWEAFCLEAICKGLFQDKSDDSVRINYILNNFHTGDIVFLYKLGMRNQRVNVRDIEYCVPCIIRDISESNVLFEKITFLGTPLFRREAMEYANQVAGINFYKAEDFDKTIVEKDNININAIGVDKYLFDEDYYMVKPFIGSDTFSSKVVTDNGIELKDFNSIEIVYLTLRSWDISFNDSYKDYLSEDQLKEIDGYVENEIKNKPKIHQYNRPKAVDIDLKDDLFDVFFS